MRGSQLKTTFIFILLSTFLVNCLPGYGESASPVNLLGNVQTEATRQYSANRKREQIFQQELVESKRQLAELKIIFRQRQNTSEKLEDIFSENETSLVDKQKIYDERLGAFNELLGVVKQVAADTQGQFENSLISTQQSDRLQHLEIIASQKNLPTTEQLSGLWQALLWEMRQQAKNLRYQTSVIDASGQAEVQDVTRIGPFIAFNDEGKFLNYNVSTQSFNELSRQPRSDYLGAAKTYSLYSEGGEALVPIDPSRGAILALLIQRPSLEERIQQGGAIAYIILAIAAFGIMLALSRLIMLARANLLLHKQLRNMHTPTNDNALGQILTVVKENHGLGIENLELKFDDIILKTSSRLRRGLSTLKVLAGMAPLLGLLGTVTGMIETFQAITLFGSGDARLMAGGISQALVTTALGLSAAIPILLLHSIANSRSRILVELLEEQTAGIVATYACDQKASSDQNATENRNIK